MNYEKNQRNSTMSNLTNEMSLHYTINNRDELRKNQCNLTISNLTNEMSLHYTINNRSLFY